MYHIGDDISPVQQSFSSHFQQISSCHLPSQELATSTTDVFPDR